MTFDENKTRIKNFVDCYEAFLRKKNKNGNPLKCVSITRKEYDDIVNRILARKWRILLNIKKPSQNDSNKLTDSINKLKEDLDIPEDEIIQRAFCGKDFNSEAILTYKESLIVPDKIYNKYESYFKKFEENGKRFGKRIKKCTIKENKNKQKIIVNYEINLINSSSGKKKN